MRHKRVHAVGFHLHEVPEQARLIYGVHIQETSYPWRVGNDWKGGLQGTGNVLFLDLDAGYGGVFRL